MKQGKGNLVAQRRAREARNRAVIQHLKDVPCADCSRRYPFFVMQFDHCRGEKKFTINKRPHIALATILAEIEKCDVVCANCHATRTYARNCST